MGTAPATLPPAEGPDTLGLCLVMARRGYTPGDPVQALADELAIDRLCADEWPCPTCQATARRHLTFIAADGSGRWRSIALCPACGTGEAL